MEEKRKVRMNGRRGNDEWFGENREGEGERDAQVKRGRKRCPGEKRKKEKQKSEQEREKTLAWVERGKIEKMNA